MYFKDINNHLKEAYSLIADDIILHRDLIGRVFIVYIAEKKYILKVYRNLYKENALQTADVMGYLKENEYPAPEIYKTVENKNVSSLKYEDKECYSILSEFIDGKEPDKQFDASEIACQLSLLHILMKKYPDRLVNRTKNEYLDDFIKLMEQKGLDQYKISDLNDLSNNLWQRITKLPKSFCHGDFHTGNIIEDRKGRYIFFDYDDMSGDWPIMDVAYLCDVTHFNNYSHKMFEDVQCQFQKVCLGYERKRKRKIKIREIEYKAIFDFIAVRHFQILSRIINCQGLECISIDTCNEQYHWLMDWNDCCQKKL